METDEGLVVHEVNSRVEFKGASKVYGNKIINDIVEFLKEIILPQLPLAGLKTSGYPISVADARALSCEKDTTVSGVLIHFYIDMMW